MNWGKSKLFIGFFFFNIQLLVAQNEITPTDSLIINGQVAQNQFYTLKDLDTFQSEAIPNQIIYNQKGEVKDTLKGMRGIPLKKILAPVKFTNEKPKELNTFYFVFTASDDYKVVFSWNEIYNTEVGNKLYIITEINGFRIQNLKQRIAFISAADLKPGRRYIKGLSSIKVCKL